MPKYLDHPVNAKIFDVALEVFDKVFDVPAEKRGLEKSSTVRRIR
jgi:hypothetical protein